MKRLLSATIATAVAAATLTATATAAQARQATINSITVKPALAVQTKVNRQVINFEVRTTGATDLDVSVQAHRGNGSVIVSDMRQASPGVWRGSGFLYNWEVAGRYNVDVSAYDAEYNETKRYSTFQVRRATYVSGFRAAPGKVRRGKAITVSGALKGLNNLGEYGGVRGQRVTVFFKRKGTNRWVPFGVVTTGPGGKFARRYKAKASGWWAVRYNGTAWWYRTNTGAKGVVVR